MNIFSKISTFVSFYYFSKCNIYASTLSKGNDLFLLFIFFSSHPLTSAVQRYDTDPPSRTPTPGLGTACFLLFLRLSADNISRCSR